MDLLNKTAIITGASRGIGAEAARAFVAAGANVLLLARGRAEIEALAAELGDQALARTCDVSNPDDLVSAVAAAKEAFGSVDILINNAGAIEPIARMDQADPLAWGQVIDINLKGVFYGMHAVLPHMMDAGGGSIITVSSGAAHGPVEAWSHYCSSKAGAAMLTSCLHKEYAEMGIRAMGLSPGTVATQMQKEIKSSGINPVSQLDWSVHIPADWPAKTLVWMCTDAADAFLGQEISLREDDIRKAVGLI